MKNSKRAGFSILLAAVTAISIVAVSACSGCSGGKSKYKVSGREWNTALGLFYDPMEQFLISNGNGEITSNIVSGWNFTIISDYYYSGEYGELAGTTTYKADISHKRSSLAEDSNHYYYWQDGDTVYEAGNVSQKSIEFLMVYSCGTLIGELFFEYPVIDHYEEAIYDENDHTYKLDFNKINEQDNGETENVVVGFEDGKLIKFIFNKTYGVNIIKWELSFTDYGTTTIELPEQ